MRGSLDILEKNDRIRAEREFEVVDDYLYLLKLRFEDRLTIEKDYQDKDFSLPPFSIQILVENAVKHGIYGTEDKKGTVSIKSYRRDEFHVIEVTDNGVGMSAVHPHDQKSEERLHLGIRNVESRLRIMCAGTLTLESIKGKGTTATIRIPVKTDSDSPE